MRVPGERDEVRPDGHHGREKPAGDQVLVSLDFETYYDKDYTLRKLSTSEYVRDPRFEALSCAIKLDDGPTLVYLGHDDIQAALNQINWSKATLLCHHAHFDGLILSHHFGYVPNRYACTLSMGRALHPRTDRNDLHTLSVKYNVINKLEMPDVKGKHLADLDNYERQALVEYNATDVDAMYEIYLLMLPKMPSFEMDLIDVTVRMFANPVLELDTELAQSELKREIEERAEIIAKSGASVVAAEAGVTLKPKRKGEPVTEEMLLASPKAFTAMLRYLGEEPPMKVSTYNGKDTYALSKADEDFTALLEHDDERIVSLVAGRLAAKSTIGETRAARLLRAGSDGKRLPVYLLYCGAHTTRWSGGDKLNFQNLKKKGQIRRAIKAPEGYSIVVIDSSQIEARVLAWLAGEEWLLKAFKDKADPYCQLASDIYNRVITKADKEERFVGKTATLGLGFQMGGPKFQKSVIAQSLNQLGRMLKIELKVCYEIVRTYRKKNANIEAFWDFMHNTIIADMGALPKDEVRHLDKKHISWGRDWMGLDGHLKLMYPNTKVKFDKVSGRKDDSGLFGDSKVDDKQILKVEEASYQSLGSRSKLYGGLGTENLVQYLARIVVAMQMLKIAKRYRVVMMTHDEVAFLARSDEADEALKWGLEVMHTPPEWAPDLPVAAEGGHDTVYSK